MSKAELVGFFQRNKGWVTAGKILAGAAAGILGTTYAMGSSAAHTADHLQSLDSKVDGLARSIESIEKDRTERARDAQKERADMKADIAGIKSHVNSIDENFQWLRDRLIGKR